MHAAPPRISADYASVLLAHWPSSATVAPAAATPDPPPAIDWARCGAMALTGPSNGMPVIAPGSLAACARGALRALRRLAGCDVLSGVDGPELLGERAAIFDLRRRGRTSPGGSCRLLETKDGWIAVNLARPDDRQLLPAWLETSSSPELLDGDPWAALESAIAGRPAEELVGRARLIGLPIARADRPRLPAPPWLRIDSVVTPVRHRDVPGSRPRVVDLSSLWAGPLCTHLLAACGADVIKVESRSRPDGARSGPAAFFDLMNAGKRSVALDFSDASDRRRLAALLESADIVVESSRPRALRQLGIEARDLLGLRPGMTWLGITGYGRRGQQADWVAFGDDAGAASGLAMATGSPDRAPLFCGDAIADPLTGLHGAVAALASWRAGGGQLLDLPLRDVTAHVLGFGGTPGDARVEQASNGADFKVAVGGEEQEVLAPRARPADEAARPLGADTAAVLSELGC